MSVKIKGRIEKLYSSYSLCADYIKQINNDVERRCKDAYISQYVEYKNVIKYFELYIKHLERFHEKFHSDISKCPHTESDFKNIYRDSKSILNRYKGELVDIKERIANCSY